MHLLNPTSTRQKAPSFPQLGLDDAWAFLTFNGGVIMHKDTLKFGIVQYTIEKIAI